MLKDSRYGAKPQLQGLKWSTTCLLDIVCSTRLLQPNQSPIPKALFVCKFMSFSLQKVNSLSKERGEGVAPSKQSWFSCFLLWVD